MNQIVEKTGPGNYVRKSRILVNNYVGLRELGLRQLE
jgi:hypothetical protein